MSLFPKKSVVYL